jgi:hypothetical protein
VRPRFAAWAASAEAAFPIAVARVGALSAFAAGASTAASRVAVVAAAPAAAREEPRMCRIRLIGLLGEVPRRGVWGKGVGEGPVGAALGFAPI